jgi:hypothetical protein
MKIFLKSIFILGFLSLISSCSTHLHHELDADRSIASVASDQNCNQIIKNFLIKSNHDVDVSKEAFVKYYDDLNDTLSGNLATVFRSEWKAKDDFDIGSKYLNDVFMAFGGNTIVNKYSASRGIEFIESVVSELRKIGKIGKISMRDPPAPIGSFDRTFTYYTKALADGSGAKHQVRLRTYLRELVVDEMVESIPVPGFIDGNYIEVTKLGPNKFKLVKASKKDLIENATEELLTLNGLKKSLNENLTFYAYPHAKGFKLEIKTKPHDEVENQKFEKLLGKNYVQKLSIDIRPSDIGLLFKDRKTTDSKEMLAKLQRLKEKALENPKNALDRTNAIFNLLFDANEMDEDFFVAQGATEYKRFAFELEVPDLIDGEKVRIQTTFDYDMGIRKNYDEAGNFLDPLKSLINPIQKPFSDKEDLHIELKIPKTLVERTLKEKVSEALLSVMRIFNSQQVTNKGKFNHIENQKDIFE